MRRLPWLFGLVAAALVSPESGRAAGLLEPSLLPADDYAETYTFVADLDDGAYVQVQLSVTNLGPGSGHGICRALWVPPTGRPFTAHARVDRSGLSHGAGPPGEWLRIGPCQAVAGDALSVEATVGGRTVRLRYARPAAPELPPSDVIALGGREHRTQLLLAASAVEARLEKEGREPLSRRGGGYADHSVSLVEPKGLAKRWVRFRALREGSSTLLLAREAFAGDFAPLWRRTAGAYRSGGRFALERLGDRDRPTFTATFEGEAGRFAIRTRRLLFRHAPVEELGLVGKLVGPLVGAPVTYTFRATLSEEGRPDVPGIVEISLAED